VKESDLSELIADVKEQVLYMQELGVEAFSVDLGPVTAVRRPMAGNIAVSNPRSQDPGIAVPAVERVPAPSRPGAEQTGPPAGKAGSLLAALPSLTKRPVHASPERAPLKNLQMPKTAETKPPAVPEALPQQPQKDENVFGALPSALPKTDDTIESIRAEIGDCIRCPLYAGRKQIVHSTGNFSADLMFVGEAPGADEDEQGVPFIGRAGQLLTKIIESIGMKREDVFIGNINRCRPPGNRPPTLPEAETCRPFLQREIAVVRPKVIVVMGNTATQNLLNTKTGITKLRGNFQEYLGVKLMPTFHPAYLLRDPNKKREVWEDMKMVRAYLESS
jgi:uracil-DNA glycosylase